MPTCEIDTILKTWPFGHICAGPHTREEYNAW